MDPRPRQIDINHDGATKLKLLRGVGPVIAGRIMDERECRPFTDCDDLCHRVDGLSAARIRSWSDNDGRTNAIVVFKAMEAEPTLEDKPLANDVDQEPVDRVYPLILTVLFSTALAVVISYVIWMVIMYTQSSVTEPSQPTASSIIIDFQCIEDSDCDDGQRCFPGQLHPREMPWDIENHHTLDIWAQSKFGLETMTSDVAGWIKWRSLSSGRKCWNISNEVGAECGNDAAQICNSGAGLTCVYGKCRHTEDQTLLHDFYGPMGEDFFESQDNVMWCDDLEGCIGPQMVEREVGPPGVLSGDPTDDLPPALDGPFFDGEEERRKCNGTTGQNMSYCENFELKLKNETVSITHEYSSVVHPEPGKKEKVEAKVIDRLDHWDQWDVQIDHQTVDPHTVENSTVDPQTPIEGGRQYTGTQVAVTVVLVAVISVGIREIIAVTIIKKRTECILEEMYRAALDTP